MDLNIDNYTLLEMKKLISLPVRYYSHKDIQEKCDASIQIIQEDQNVLSPQEQVQIILFFNQLKDALIEDYIHTQNRVVQIPPKAEYTAPIVSSINPQKREYVTRILNIDSLFRRQFNLTTSSDFVYEFKEPIKNVVSMRLATAELPNVWKTFDKNSNSFKIIYTDPAIQTPNVDSISALRSITSYKDYDSVIEMDDIIQKDIIFPEGNYNISNMLTTLNYYFTKEQIPISVSFNAVLGKLIFEIVDITDGDTTITKKDSQFKYALCFGRYNETTQLTAGYKLGFRKLEGVYHSDDEPFINFLYEEDFVDIDETYKYQTVVADAVYGAAEDTYIYLCINDFQNNVKNTVITDNSIDNVLARLTITSDSFTVVIDNDSDKVFKTREYFGPVTLQKFQIQLKNKYGKLIDIYNENFNFALEVKQIYQ